MVLEISDQGAILNISDQEYKEIELDRAFQMLYNEGVTPEQYRKEYEKRYGKEYQMSEMLAGQQDERIRSILYERD